MISDAFKLFKSDNFEFWVSDEYSLKAELLISCLESGYALEVTLELIRDLLRCLSWRVRQKYRTMGATRATTTIGTTIAGISVLRGVPCDEGEDVDVGGAVPAGVGDELVVEDGKVEVGDVAV